MRVVEDALTLLRSDKLTAKKLARAADGDVDLIRFIAEQNGPLPGSIDEVSAVRELSREALVLLLSDLLDEPESRLSRAPKAKKNKAKSSKPKAKKSVSESSDDDLDPYWAEKLRDHQASELIGFAAELVSEGNHNTIAIIAKADADRDLLVRARAKGQEHAATLATGAIGHPAERELMAGANNWKRAVELMSAAILKYDDGAADGRWM